MGDEMGRKTILIVDDTPENIDILKEILKGEYNIKAAPRGAIALKIAMTKPDLIILDIVMPEMDGFEVCKKLKEEATTKDIPVIFLSGNCEMGDIEKGRSLGAVDFLFKPVDKDKVVALVELNLK